MVDINIFRKKPGAQVAHDAEVVSSGYSPEKVFLSREERARYEQTSIFLISPPAIPTSTESYNREEFIGLLQKRIDYWQQSNKFSRILDEVRALERIKKELSEQGE
ncbi:MAG: hypothetical protein V1887_01320 [Candidatus Aenigmatarchaeota archaeon]